MSENGLVLGQFAEETYSAVSLPLEPGDRCVLYTDGVIETSSPSEEEFGTGRFMQLMESKHSLGAEQFIDALLDELSAMVWTSARRRATG